jgi:rod shape determining protein RodA
MMIDRRLFIHFDWALVALVLLIASMGLLNLYSTTWNMGGSTTPLYVKQIFSLLIGLALMICVAFIDYHLYSDFASLIYVASLFGLVLVMLHAATQPGAQRWIKVGSLSIQPSEFAKIALILMMARFFQTPRKREGYSLRDLLWPFLSLCLPLGLILRQPDLGTAIIFLLIFVSVLLFVKVHWTSWLVLGSAGISILPVLWSLLKDYQKKRIVTFFNPDLDPLGAGYHIIQSKIAVGSGGIVGKGFMKGTQCKLGFLPERHTDFIFSALTEEWGLIGSLFMVTLYVILIAWALRIAVQAKDRLGAILAFGVAAMLFWHVFINIGMVLGMMPVAGIPLPLFSYGGSFLLSTLIGIGLLLNVSMRRYLF